ncbi:hypothetical protein GCM10010365_61340 [Streptomyces poonensis]|uniref:Uncharacterized protein n=1 Tax=Streptomyces poonensis TaxID=68255 RepID=A0A918UT34_9ACTN|nr:hypothetical protein GCM10010365_61340 [Streptomyces poonensis]GLJ92803.1 hypothetical protein GCM10017589_54130 [Streptomyces poonensis]
MSSITRSAADFDTPNSGASRRIVKFVRQYATTSGTRSSSDSFHGRLRAGASAPSRGRCVTNLLKARGLSPVNGAVQDDSDAVITPDTVKIIAGQDHLRDSPSPNRWSRACESGVPTYGDGHDGRREAGGVRLGGLPGRQVRLRVCPSSPSASRKGAESP